MFSPVRSGVQLMFRALALRQSRLLVFLSNYVSLSAFSFLMRPDEGRK